MPRNSKQHESMAMCRYDRYTLYFDDDRSDFNYTVICQMYKNMPSRTVTSPSTTSTTTSVVKTSMKLASDSITSAYVSSRTDTNGETTLRDVISEAQTSGNMPDKNMPSRTVTSPSTTSTTTSVVKTSMKLASDSITSAYVSSRTDTNGETTLRDVISEAQTSGNMPALVGGVIGALLVVLLATVLVLIWTRRTQRFCFRNRKSPESKVHFTSDKNTGSKQSKGSVEDGRTNAGFSVEIAASELN
ncbi:uncharacterized protein LOC121385653 [Gigantopelta aegis]|uniref:uncharacterized protein LOC121385653 n=1 Tax=Gigantopelta aegis TaxID=1735272 RepID=UPI001B88A39F|nr:uncharacterized protein LOC121385653 [Gigantopelta aegis]